MFCSDCNRPARWQRDAFVGPYCDCPQRNLPTRMDSTANPIVGAFKAMEAEQRADFEDHKRFVASIGKRGEVTAERDSEPLGGSTKSAPSAACERP